MSIFSFASFESHRSRVSSFIGFFQSWMGPDPPVPKVEFTLFDAVAPTAGDRRRSETT
jgi:hypothetical protein